MSTKPVDTRVQQFFKEYIASKAGKITEESDEILRIKYPDKSNFEEYTYQSVVAKEKKIPLIAAGSPTFQNILKECLEDGVPCQIILKPKRNFETIIKKYFKDYPFACIECDKIQKGKDTISICVKTQSCYHRINNGKIVSVKVGKQEPVRFFQFYFSVMFQNKLRAKNEETFTILVDEKEKVVRVEDISEDSTLKNEEKEFQDLNLKLKTDFFDKLKAVADEKLNMILRDKLAIFDLQLYKEKKAKLRTFEKRLRRERREHLISKKIDFDFQKWRTNYEVLLKNEEESFVTQITVKFINLLVINTAKVKFEVSLDNKASLQSSIFVGIDSAIEVVCPICRKTFSEGYATQDSLYVCKSCIRQSIDTGKIYSKKAALTLDPILNEYIEQDMGFICAVCGKKHSRLLEFKCAHDNSSVCINHYGVCDVCGRVFSKLNLSYTYEFRRQLCPKHASKNMNVEH